uniref:Si:dkey-57n24.6 n=1 Tax=Sinocyclocheilus anshuiensis TaxID=1608454 RepID=A0A671TEY7_9TELE
KVLQCSCDQLKHKSSAEEKGWKTAFSYAKEINSHCFAKTVLYTFLALFFIFLNQAELEEHLTNSEKRKRETKKDTSSEVVEAPRAKGYYCIEYNMLPDDPEPTRVDLVMFGLAAKLYMVLKPWREGNKVWVSWSQTLKLNVTKELLIKLASHKITVRVWDSKDKVSFKARNDRPKAFRLPQERTGEDPEQMGVQEGFWNITLDQPLLSKQLKAELNPLVITVLSASSLPSSPVPFHVLKAKCHSVYCQYKFRNMPVYRTKGHDHNANIYFKEVNVIFTGLLSRGKLCEFLNGPPMKIEVHDRDRKKEKPSSTPAIFGTDPKDAKDDLWVTCNALKADTELHDPYGIAKLDLSDLLRGCRYLKLKLPIRSSSEVPSDIAMPVGHYLEADAQLKVQVEIAHTLHHEDGNSDRDCPFGRVIYVFKYNNTPVLAKLTSEILQINADAFQLKHYPEETIQRLLSGHNIRTKDRENKRLNVLTGFHMMDKALHIFVLEGFKDQAVKRLWTTVSIKLDGDEEEQVTALYNSDLSFSERLYDMLDVGLSPVCLVKPLETILMEPLVFIRNTVPHACLEALKRISHICKAKKFQEVVHHDLFPSADMILSLSKEFGSDLGRGELWLATETQQSQDIPDRHNIRKRTHTPLDNFNREYFQWKWNEGNNVKDFIQVMNDAYV